jgi:hypothetical protein
MSAFLEMERKRLQTIQTYLCLGVVCFTGFNLSAWGEGGQKSIILILLDLLFG